MASVVTADDLSSGAHVARDTAHIPISTDIQEVQVASSVLDTTVLESVKITAQHQKVDSSPMLESSRGGSLSTEPDQPSDVASVHSLPAVHISESPGQESSRPSDASNPTASQPSSRPQSARGQPSQPQSTFSQQTRRARHRSAIEVRSSNRLSGFFTNLMHRHAPHPSTIVEDQNPPKPNTDKNSRSPSPQPVRAVTPPPALPPPTLQELGLSLSAVTTNLSPAHFSAPPASGAFLAPHYLLLCHAQGLDVLPLVSPPAPQPYSLVRRVSFKSVVVMEHRGVLVAIAGRRDGVRVYALEEIKKAIEWRIDVEVRRERERLRREAAKRSILRIENDPSDNGEKKSRKTSLSTPPPSDDSKPNILRKGSHASIKSSPSRPPPLVPRSPRTPARKSRLPSLRLPPLLNTSDPPLDQPPPYAIPSETQPPPFLRSQPSAVSVRARTRGNSVSNVLANVTHATRNGESSRALEGESKGDDDWAGSSDDEAIDIRAAAGGSQVLDERTSATLAATRNASSTGVIVTQSTPTPRPPASGSRRRPSNLNLSAVDNTIPPQPSPVPTLLTLRQALQHLPPNPIMADMYDDNDDDDDETTADGRVSLAQVLWESRLPDLPPPGSVRPQEPILLSASHPIYQEPSSPRSSDDHGSSGRQSAMNQPRDRRRWSTILRSSPFHRTPGPGATPSSPRNLPFNDQPGRDHGNGNVRKELDNDEYNFETSSVGRPSTALSSSHMSIGPSSATSTASMTQRSSRFIPRIISNALSRRSDDALSSPITQLDMESSRWLNMPPPPPPQPPPKLEYVKLPGTKGALLIKAVETQKKSFLAILCGDNGEKVELFAGTYRTALGLSRTFILPDSPRSLELQLQGDDLVEVFLVFSQNVFGLEPATVRVREVRIGRAERRAARRRARENRSGDAALNEIEPNEDETSVNVNIGVSVSVGSTVVATGDGPDRSSTPTLIANEHPDAPQDEPRSANPELAASNSAAYSEEFSALATAKMGPYTTFQQLNFSPKFPLASVADEYIIPPTYPDFLDHTKNEEDEDENCSHSELSQTQFSPPGLPVPTPTGPTKWYYKDPKGVVHGPWASALMQAWYKDGLLPADLPVRREEEADYTLLRDLRMQCVDPAHPFRSPPPVRSIVMDTKKPKDKLLPPISLLSQPRHFGPPALFYSSRGGHSTTIVDARGRSVLKGRFIWSSDDAQNDTKGGKMGDVKRLEAFDVKDRAVLVALRQGGLEAMDLSDALLRPADQSRVILPSFNPPPNAINRRPPFVWKIGTPFNLPNGVTTTLSISGKPGFSHLPRMSSIGIVGSPGLTGNDMDCDSSDEVLFLGRKDNEIYFCERGTGSFRILRLTPNINDD